MNDKELLIALCLGQSVKIHQMLDVPLEVAEACCEMHAAMSRKYQSIQKNYQGQNFYWLVRESNKAEKMILRFLRLKSADHGEESPQLVLNLDWPDSPPSAEYWEQREKQNHG